MRTIINLTSLAVAEEIDSLLSNYPNNHPYRSAFSLPESRQKLTAFVLRKIPQQYTTFEDSQEPPTCSKSSGCLLEQRLQIEDWIEKGMKTIFQDENKLGIDWRSQTEKLIQEPSHWFG